MENKGVFTKVLAVAGCLFVWAPLVLPFVFSFFTIFRTPVFHFDYLMPAELFPSALLGGCLLIWAALRAHSYARLVGLSLGLALSLLVIGQVLAVGTGLALGEIEPSGLAWGLVVSSIVGYTLFLVVLGIVGILLTLGLFKQPQSNSASA